MSTSKVNVYEGRASTQDEIDRVSKKRTTGLYKEMVARFCNLQKRTWTYPVPEGVNGSTYLSGFKRAVETLHYQGKVSVHGCRSKDGDAIVLRREDTISADQSTHAQANTTPM